MNSSDHTQDFQAANAKRCRATALQKGRRLIVNADDFGASSSINRAVIQAHREGILTSASLMVNGAAFEEAVEFAKAHRKLGVGLHLVLCRGRSTLPFERIPSLVERTGEFAHRPVWAGFKYYFLPVRQQLREEITAQFEKFAQTGLELDHVNGHLHFHLHPMILRLLMERSIAAFRLTNVPLKVDWPLGEGRWFYRWSHALIFGRLSRRAMPVLVEKRIAHVQNVFGLLEDGRVTEEYILKLLRVLPEGDSELYSHPSLHEFRHELDALVSPRVKQALAEEEIELIRYKDLWRSSS